MIIDAHHHWIPSNIIEDLPKYLNPGERIVKDGENLRILRGHTELFTLHPHYSDVQLQLKEMDAAGVDVAVMSIACLQQWNTVHMARRINDAYAELQERYPQRIVGLANVPPFGKGAVKELERAIRRLGLKGAALTTNFGGKYPDDAAYRPFFKKAEELGIPIVFHAAVHPVEYKTFERYGVLRTFGRLFDHTLAVVSVLQKVAKRFPKLKFLHGHLGGSFFILRERLLDLKRSAEEEQLYNEIIGRQFFFDTAPGRWKYYHWECAAHSLGTDHILLGSDYPVLPSFLPYTLETLNQMRISEEDKRKILFENAIKLFKL
jgi:predicted TIM-barrel fold metal-dependent hydrolase